MQTLWVQKGQLGSTVFYQAIMTAEEVKALIFRYFIGYWNNRRICSTNEGLSPMVKRQRYNESLDAA